MSVYQYISIISISYQYISISLDQCISGRHGISGRVSKCLGGLEAYSSNSTEGGV